MEDKTYVLSTEVEVLAKNKEDAEQTGLEDIKQLGLAWEVKEKEDPKFIIAIAEPNCGGAEIRIPTEEDEIIYQDVHKTTLLMGMYQAPTQEEAIEKAAEDLDLPQEILYVYSEIK